MEIWLLEQIVRHPWLDVFFSLYTRLGDIGVLWFVIFGVFALNKKTRTMAIVGLVAMLVEVILVNGMLKPFFQRPRPFEVVDFTLLIPIPHGSSFPSGHTANAFAAAWSLWLFKAKYRELWLFLAVLMGFSRLYLFVHYPTDVVVGALIGMGIAYAVKRVYELKFAQNPLPE